MTSQVNPGWPFGTLPPLAFDVIMADPPWRFALRSEKNLEKSAQGKYACMTLDAIKALPVADLAAPDCLLWLWATNPMLPQGLEVLAAWGFTFKSAGHWAKTTKHGKQAFGTGYVLRCAGEPFLIGTRGRPKTSRSVRSVVIGETREHSRKPVAAYVAAETLIPSARRADLFSRQTRIGWESWGLEKGKFDAVA